MVTGLGIFDYFSDYVGKVMFLVGVILLVTGILTLNMTGSTISAGSLFIGILFIVFGLFVQMGFFSGRIRSFGGVGTILICLSIILVSFSLAVSEFVNITGYDVVLDVFRGAVMGSQLIMYAERPYLWLSVICLQFGIGFFFAGLAFKIVQAVKP